MNKLSNTQLRERNKILRSPAFLTRLSNMFRCIVPTGLDCLFIPEGSQELAYTDGKATYINPTHRYFNDLDEEEVMIAIMGLRLHELLHPKYTDLSAFKQIGKINANKFSLYKPLFVKKATEKEDEDVVEQEFVYDYEDYIAFSRSNNETIEAKRAYMKAFKGLAQQIFNTIEDGRIERIGTFEFPGVAYSLYFNNRLLSLQVEEDEKKADDDIKKLHSLIWNKALLNANSQCPAHLKPLWNIVCSFVSQGRNAHTCAECLECSLMITRFFMSLNPTPEQLKDLEDLIKRLNQGRSTQSGNENPETDPTINEDNNDGSDSSDSMSGEGNPGQSSNGENSKNSSKQNNKDGEKGSGNGSGNKENHGEKDEESKNTDGNGKEGADDKDKTKDNSDKDVNNNSDASEDGTNESKRNSFENKDNSSASISPEERQRFREMVKNEIETIKATIKKEEEKEKTEEKERNKLLTSASKQGGFSPFSFTKTELSGDEKGRYLLIANEPENRRIIRRFTRQMRDILLFNQDETERYETRGYIDPNCLGNLGGGNIFSRRIEADQVNDLIISLDLDVSGSTTSAKREHMIRQAAIIIAEVCDAVGIPINVFGFGNCFHIYRRANTKIKSQKYNVVTALSDGGGTPMLEMIKTNTVVYEKDRDKTHIVFVITDGSPFNLSSTATAIKNLTQKGVAVFGLGIKCDKQGMETLFGNNYIDATDMSLIPKAVCRIVKDNLLKR